MILPKIVKSYNQNNHVIEFGESTSRKYMIFQSYDSVMCVITKDNIYFNDDVDDYTKTTRKYLYKFLDDYRFHSDKIQTWDIIDNIQGSNNGKNVIIKYIIDTGNKIDDKIIVNDYL